jgi:hypothetical protein
MKKVCFLAECGNPGADGITLDLAHLGLPKHFAKLLTNFNASELIGLCKVSKAPDGLLVEAEVPEQLLDCYPAIGFKVLESKPNEHGGRDITASTLLAVSLSATPNVDSSIKTLREQLAH